jgi:hypothetical protein
MWRILVGIGVLLLITGVLIDGRNPVVAIQESMRSPTPTMTATPSHTSTAIPTLTPTITQTPTITLTYTPSLTLTPSSTLTPSHTPKPKKLYFYKKNDNDSRGCISFQIRGVNVRNWTVWIATQQKGGTFDGGGNARVCGLKWGRKFNFTIANASGKQVPGGVAIESKDRAIWIANWK